MIFVVASMTNRTMPVNVFRMKPAHMYGYIFRTSAKGTSRAQPKIRKAIRPLIPATTPIPSVWRNRTPGYARSEFDSRTHTEKPLCSIAARNCIIRKVLYSQSDATIPESKIGQNAKVTSSGIWGGLDCEKIRGREL